jgi:hypothetical protein
MRVPAQLLVAIDAVAAAKGAEKAAPAQHAVELQRSKSVSVVEVASEGRLQRGH